MERRVRHIVRTRRNWSEKFSVETEEGMQNHRLSSLTRRWESALPLSCVIASLFSSRGSKSGKRVLFQSISASGSKVISSSSSPPEFEEEHREEHNITMNPLRRVGCWCSSFPKTDFFRLFKVSLIIIFICTLSNGKPVSASEEPQTYVFVQKRNRRDREKESSILFSLPVSSQPRVFSPFTDSPDIICLSSVSSLSSLSLFICLSCLLIISDPGAFITKTLNAFFAPEYGYDKRVRPNYGGQYLLQSHLTLSLFSYIFLQFGVVYFYCCYYVARLFHCDFFHLVSLPKEIA